MSQQAIAHGSFSIERTYAAAPARVFQAFADPELKQHWFVGPEGWTSIRREIQFHPGGTEIAQGRFPSGFETLYTARFHAIEENRRIVSVYDMHLNGVHHSVSLATVELEPTDDGTRLTYTEQTAWLDGTEAAAGTAAREGGVGTHLALLENLLRERG